MQPLSILLLESTVGWRQQEESGGLAEDDQTLKSLKFFTFWIYVIDRYYTYVSCFSKLRKRKYIGKYHNHLLPSFIFGMLLSCPKQDRTSGFRYAMWTSVLSLGRTACDLLLFSAVQCEAQPSNVRWSHESIPNGEMCSFVALFLVFLVRFMQLSFCLGTVAAAYLNMFDGQA